MRKRSSALLWGLAASISIGAAATIPSVLAKVPDEPPPNSAQSGGNGKAIDTVQDLSRAFRNVGKEVEPSVVSIKIRKKVEAPAVSRIPPQLRPFFEQMPDFPGFEDGPGGGPSGELLGQGSGVIVAVEGNTAYVMTNNHVAGEADEMQIALNDGRVIENGKLVGADAKTDLAVVKIEAEGLKAAKWGDSDQLDKGDWVLAFGSPFGYVGSMTHGIVSATNRTDLQIIPQGYENFLQIDAPINPGNSGGPLTNIHGEVVGINTAIASRTGGFQGIGFAIPSNQAKQIYQILRDEGKVVRGWLGVSIAPVSDPDFQPIAKSFGYDKREGVLVQDTFPDTPAWQKLKQGDIIMSLNGKPVADANQLRSQIALLKPGTEAKLHIFRDRKEQDVTVKLGEQPADMAAMGQNAPDQTEEGPATSGGPKLGVVLNDLTPDIASQLGFRGEQRGAVIRRVAPASPAARAGLTPGEVITRVGDQDVKTAAEATAALRKADLAKGVRLYVARPGGGRFVFVQAAPARPEKEKDKE